MKAAVPSRRRPWSVPRLGPGSSRDRSGAARRTRCEPGAGRPGRAEPQTTWRRGKERRAATGRRHLGEVAARRFSRDLAGAPALPRAAAAAVPCQSLSGNGGGPAPLRERASAGCGAELGTHTLCFRGMPRDAPGPGRWAARNRRHQVSRERPRPGCAAGRVPLRGRAVRRLSAGRAPLDIAVSLFLTSMCLGR